jgi:hypothetical protein
MRTKKKNKIVAMITRNPLLILIKHPSNQFSAVSIIIHLCRMGLDGTIVIFFLAFHNSSVRMACYDRLLAVVHCIQICSLRLLAALEQSLEASVGNRCNAVEAKGIALRTEYGSREHLTNNIPPLTAPVLGDSSTE